MNDNLKRTWKKAVVAKFKKLTRQLLEVLRKTTNTLIQDSRYHSLDLNLGPLEYESGI
jgi:hypothetical protein